MKGIMFRDKYPGNNEIQVIQGIKTQTRRMPKWLQQYNLKPDFWNKKAMAVYLEIHSRYKIGGIVYIKQKTEHQKNKMFAKEIHAKYFIEITGVRIERLHDISDEDCFKEGIIKNEFHGFINPPINYNLSGDCKYFGKAKEAYFHLLKLVNPKLDINSNPWVIVYDFKLIK